MDGYHGRALKGGVCKEFLQQEEGVTKKTSISRRRNTKGDNDKPQQKASHTTKVLQVSRRYEKVRQKALRENRS